MDCERCLDLKVVWDDTEANEFISLEIVCKLSKCPTDVIVIASFTLPSPFDYIFTIPYGST